MSRFAVTTGVVLFFACALFAAPPVGYSLKYSDEFDGTSLDQTKWGFGFGFGTNSGSFSEQNRQQNLTFSNGCAVIKAEVSGNTYYSAAINTKGKMDSKYGYWEIRSKISAHVSGCLPAFWQKLESDIWPPELDIYEFFGTDSRQSMTVHYGSSSQSETQVNVGDVTADFHVFGLECTSTYMRWWTDGALVREITPSSQGAFFSEWIAEKAYTMLNIHMTDMYSWLGSVDKASTPVYMYIDYFRLYQQGGSAVTGPLTIYKESPIASQLPTLRIRFSSINPDPAGRSATLTGRILSRTGTMASEVVLCPRQQ